MYDDFDDDYFLAPEALLSLHFDSDDRDIGRADAMECAECLRSGSSACAFDAPDDDLVSDDDVQGRRNLVMHGI